MKLAAFADTHLPGPIGWQAKHAMAWRMEDFRQAFWATLEEIREYGPGVAVFAGDAFQYRHPASKWVIEFVDGIQHLAESMHVFLVPGNHDLTREGSILEILIRLGNDRIHYIDTPHAIEIGGFQVFGMPWVTGKHIAAAMGTADRGTINRSAEELVQTGIRALLAQPFDGPRIFVGHLIMIGSYFGERAPVLMGEEIFWQSSWLDGFDAVALGHLHRHQLPDPSRPHIAYCGSTERLDFGERDEDKGWMSIDLSDEKPAWEFHKIYSRPIVQIKMVSTQEPFPDVHPESIVKVIVHLEAGQHAPEIDVDCKYLLPPIYLWAEEPRARRWAAGTENLPIEEQLKLFWQDKGFSPEKIETHLEYAKGVMADVGSR